MTWTVQVFRQPDRALAYYVEWHLRRAWAPLLFEDEQLEQARSQRHPVAPPRPSATASEKKIKRTTPDGLPVHTLHTLLNHLGTCCRNTCRVAGAGPDAPTFQLLTEADPLQAKALQLLRQPL